MHEKRIVAAMIAGGASLSGEHLKKCVESTAPFVDAIYIAYNGSGPFLLDAEFLKSHKTEVRYFPWEQDIKKVRTGGPVNGPIHSPSTEQRRIGCIDDCVH